ncbi:hypothetical protein NDI56_14015 [Haloarcula sp. S1CR25-12]|uniref:Uncharacterized protein n=1 Tax=Haloarcula saliterrae TaxID=2950534 RepID=A0ABU2FE31_9EURY|nr:hypothetical protein [Haloarcula sp. S1CR25-12]MDS0260517.1 hypothetical protein [Haloarcula sp. S1CR25-12]
MIATDLHGTPDNHTLFSIMNVTDHTEHGREITLRITDHTDADHRLTLTRTGTVTDHWCDQYPSDDDPTPLERERLARAERFARYYLKRRSDVEAVEPYTDGITDPDPLVVTALVLAAMSQETLTERLGTYYEQLTASQADDSPPVSPPQTTAAAECQSVEQDICLTAPAEAVAQLSDVLHEIDGLATVRHVLDVCPDRGDSDLLERLGRLLPTTATDGDGAGRGERFLRLASPLRVHWETDGPTRVEYGDDIGSDADTPISARLQLTAAHRPVISVAAFQRTLVDHLRCQARDCYVGMGLRPPSHLRVTGRGISACTDRYEHLDTLQNYHDDHAIVDWTQLGARPDR